MLFTDEDFRENSHLPIGGYYYDEETAEVWRSDDGTRNAYAICRHYHRILDHFHECRYYGGYAIFNQLPLLFVISLPIGLAKKAAGRAAMESFVIYIIFNYFIQSLLTFFGDTMFHLDFAQEIGGTSGLTMVAGIKTMDMSVIGAIMIAAIAVWIHNRWYDKKLPSVVSSFQGSALIVIIGFVFMIPMSFAVCFIWPGVQSAILGLQEFLSKSGNLGVFLFTFLERITLPTGLHHFLWTPFDLGPAVIADGNWTHWMAHVNEYAASTAPLKELFPTGGFALYGNCAVWGMPAIALAMYKTARPENRKKVAAMLISAAIPAVLCGITEPIEFTFLFISPMLFAVGAVLAALLSTVLYMFGVVGY
jgi:PTS system arbutin-like IIC component